jgi:hypothetical protein
MLRRDIRICLGINPDTGDKIDYQAIWPGAMATLAGIDLLGKFVAGGDSPRNSGKRFRRFITEYFETISPEASSKLVKSARRRQGAMSED